MMTMTTMLIITIVKSSLALSLGLVGALSIVRFRAAIKEPEELSYLFLAIALGLGLGADQRLITLIGFVIIAIIIAVRALFRKAADKTNLQLTVYSADPQHTPLNSIVEILNQFCGMVNLRRFDESGDKLEASFLVQFNNFEQLEESRAALQKLNSSVRLTYLDNRGIQ